MLFYDKVKIRADNLSQRVSYVLIFMKNSNSSHGKLTNISHLNIQIIFFFVLLLVFRSYFILFESLDKRRKHKFSLKMIRFDYFGFCNGYLHCFFSCHFWVIMYWRRSWYNGSLALMSHNWIVMVIILNNFWTPLLLVFWHISVYLRNNIHVDIIVF